MKIKVRKSNVRKVLHRIVEIWILNDEIHLGRGISGNFLMYLDTLGEEDRYVEFDVRYSGVDDKFKPNCYKYYFDIIVDGNTTFEQAYNVRIVTHNRAFDRTDIINEDDLREFFNN